MTPAEDFDFLLRVGGHPVTKSGKAFAAGPSTTHAWNFGLKVPDGPQGKDANLCLSKTGEKHKEEAAAAMPRFAIQGRKTGDDEKALLYEYWRHPVVVEANGFEYPGVHQLTGSCVGAGGCNAWMTLACVEAVRVGDLEIPLIPFWLLPYGRSRYYLGDRSPGEGSTGSTFAKAAREDGVIPANTPGLPPFGRSDGLIWGGNVELKWSDGDNPNTMKLLPDSRKHLVKTTAQCQSGDDVREAIRNGYPCTAASMYAHRPSVQGTPPVLLGRHSGSWSHQMSLLAWWDHPSLGEIFWLMNQWGQDAHGKDPAGGPPGGVWITKADVDWICRDEVFAFSQFDGFPAQTLPPWTTGA